MTDNLGSAFPVTAAWYSPGLTKREYFAAKGMAAVIISCHDVPVTPEQMACDAVRYADALIAALEEIINAD